MHLPIFTHSGAVKILQQFVKSPLLMVKTKVIMLLSYIVNESENDIIHTSDKNIGFIVKVLQNTIEAENHFSRKYGYWAVEIIAGENFYCFFTFTKNKHTKKKTKQNKTNKQEQKRKQFLYVDFLYLLYFCIIIIIVVFILSSKLYFPIGFALCLVVPLVVRVDIWVDFYLVMVGTLSEIKLYLTMLTVRLN